MRSILVILVIFLISCNDEGKDGEKPTDHPSKYSEEFNQSVQAILTNYYRLTDAFVRWDSAALPELATNLEKSLDSFSSPENDSIDLNYIAQANRQVSYIKNDNTLEEKRHALHSLTENLYQFLNAVEYDRERLYLQECPMAFNDTEAAVWISAKDSIRNPYLGLHHPRYGKGMLKCGETKEVMNHTGKD